MSTAMGLTSQQQKTLRALALSTAPDAPGVLLRACAMITGAAVAWFVPSGRLSALSTVDFPAPFAPDLAAREVRWLSGSILVADLSPHGTLILEAPDRVGLVEEVAGWLEIGLALAEERRKHREAEERYTALLSAGFEGICLHRDGVLIEVNQALADLYGYSREEMLGMPVGSLAAPEIIPKIRAILASGYSGAYETIALCRDGARVPLEARGKAATFEGAPVRVAAFRDLRERKAAERELIAAREVAEEASRAKTRFLGNMSHELRTPMNGIIGFAHLMLRSPLTAQQRELMEPLLQSAQSLLALLNDLLDITRIEEGSLSLAQEPLDLPALIESTAAVVRPEVARKGLSLEVVCPRDLPQTWIGDEQKLRQVLINLLGNAVKFTHEGGVRLTVQRRPDGLVLSVSDTGIGMTDVQRSRVFERFTQADETTTRRYGGSGLGLSISRGLVEAMGGRIEATNPPSGGSVFTVTVPLQPGEAAAAPPTARQPPPVRPMRVLVADDHRVNQLVIRRLLESMGHTVVVAADGEEAVRACRQDRFDLILMDLQMPRMDGIQATRTLRALVPPLDTPIVALTARAMEADREECLDAGMDDYLTKPLDPEAFAASMARLCALREAS